MGIGLVDYVPLGANSLRGPRSLRWEVCVAARKSSSATRAQVGEADAIVRSTNELLQFDCARFVVTTEAVRAI
jgi:hypothetical protein